MIYIVLGVSKKCQQGVSKIEKLLTGYKTELNCMEQHELSIEDRLEKAYTSCKIPIEDVIAGIKQAIRGYLESQGFMVDLVKRPGTDREKVLMYFDLDRMLSYEQVRNGIIRNQSEAMRYVESKKSVVMVTMEIAERHGLSYTTVEEIRWRKR